MIRKEGMDNNVASNNLRFLCFNLYTTIENNVQPFSYTSSILYVILGGLTSNTFFFLLTRKIHILSNMIMTRWNEERKEKKISVLIKHIIFKCYY